MHKKTPYILITPIVLLGVLFVYGLLTGIIQSFGYIPALNLNSFTLDYYQELLSNESFISSLKFSLKISFLSSIIALILGTILTAALVYTGNTQGRILNIIKLVIIIPHTITAFFMIVFLSQNGLVARVFFKLGLISSQSDFPLLLFSENGFGIILAYIWKELPFVAYFSLALMASVNQSLGVAAENLGASKLRAFLYVTLPLSMPALAKAFLIILIFSFGAYDLPYLLGSTLPKALPVQAHLEYTHPDLQHRPYAMALNGLILLVGWSIAALYFLVRRIWKGSGEKHE